MSTSVTIQVMNKAIKILGFVFVFVGAVLLFRFVFGGNEDTWICQNGTWVKHGNPKEEMPLVPCEKEGQTAKELTPSVTIREVSFEESQQIAEGFAKNTSTYIYDGSDLKLKSSDTLKCPFCFEYIFTYNSNHSGYGDRKGQVLAQVITPHTIVITIDQGKVVTAVVDGSYSELENRFIK